MDIEIKNLNVKVDNKLVLNNLSLNIKKGEVHVVMGPNGAGKSTLSKVIMASSKYKVVDGDILVDGSSILNMDTSERAKLGIFLSFQDPMEIDGVSNSEFMREALSSKDNTFSFYNFVKEFEKDFSDLELNKDLMHRGVNQNFSGGEKKKNEILQMKLLKPKFIILDEIDSGLDVDSLNIVCKNISDYVKDNPDTSILIITHHPRILDFIKASFIHVLANGTIIKTGDASLSKIIEENGYKDLISSASKISEN